MKYLYINIIILLLEMFLLPLQISEAKIHDNQMLSPNHASLVVDYNTGEVLHQENADKHRYPASLTKMMTLYIAFEHVKSYRLRLDQYLTVSNNAAKNPPSKLGLLPGQKILLYDLIIATIVKSANDAAVVIAEAIGGSEENFARMMNKKAKKLGMNNSFFANASGLHNLEQKTTAYDMAKLAIALNRDFPEFYHLFAKTSFIYKNKIYHGHNNLLKQYPGANGIKTGYVNASGYNVVTSAIRGKAKLIAVVMGGRTPSARDKKTTQLLNVHFTDQTLVNNNTALIATKSHKRANNKKQITKPKKKSDLLKKSKSKKIGLR